MKKPLKPFQYLALVMILLFVIIAMACFFSPAIERDYLHSPRNYIMGTVLILYAGIRFLRVRSEIIKNDTP